MKRNITGQLAAFFEKEEYHHLLVCGAKGVGKTYSVTDFVSGLSAGHLYINFETDIKAVSLFDSMCEKKLSEVLGTFFSLTDSELKGYIFILDEIWASQGAVSMFNALEHEDPINVIAVSSRGNTGLNNGIESIRMYPLGFDEFLSATDHEWYREVIEGHYKKEKALPLLIHNELLDIYSDYLRVGGMPSAVLEYLSENGEYNIGQIQINLVQNALSVMNGPSVCESAIIGQRISELAQIIPGQIYEQKKRFVFSKIRKGLTYSDFAKPISVMAENYTVIVQQKTGENSDSFRLYPFDHGLLNAMIRKSIGYDEQKIDDCLLYTSVLIALSRRYNKVEFWESGYSAAIHFVVYDEDGRELPVFLNPTGSDRHKSPAVYLEQSDANTVISIGYTNFKRENNILHVPVYVDFLL